MTGIFIRKPWPTSERAHRARSGTQRRIHRAAGTDEFIRPYRCGMAASRSRRIVGLLVLAVFGFLAAASLLSGITLGGKDVPSIQCGHWVPRPAVGGPFYENTVITGERTFFPLGVNCTYDSPDDSFGPQTVVNSSWPSTLSWLANTTIALFGATLAFCPRALSRRRPNANS